MAGQLYLWVEGVVKTAFEMCGIQRQRQERDGAAGTNRDKKEMERPAPINHSQDLLPGSVDFGINERKRPI